VLSTPRARLCRRGVERLLDLRRQRDVLDDEARQQQPEFLELLGDVALDHVLEHAVVPRHVGDRDLRLARGLRELADEHALEVALDLVGRVHPLRADQLLEEHARVGDAKVVATERPDAHASGPAGDRELGVADQDRVGGAPLLVDVLLEVDEVDIDLERAAKAVLPALEARQHGHVLGAQRVRARPEDVGQLPLVDEDRRLVLAADQLGAVLDLVVLVGELVHQRVIAVVRPLDDVDELALDET
jgi:hypothetical protein